MHALKHTLVALCVSLLSGCGGGLGTCWVYCTFSSDGSMSTHGPYDDYTSAECYDQAEQSESPGITTCEADWESY